MADYEDLSPDQLKALCRTLQASLNLAFAAGDELVDRLRASKTLGPADRAAVETWVRAVCELNDRSNAAVAEIRAMPTSGAAVH